METSLQSTGLVQALHRRGAKCQTSATLYGIIHPIASDITPFLEYIKKSFPSYTNHGIDHSVRIVQRISAIISKQAMQELSSCEIFILVMAALFHDTGMVAPDSSIENDEKIRAVHHQRSRKFVLDYFDSRLPILDNRRLAEVIGFVVESHGLDWATLTGRDEFLFKETIFDQIVRTPIMAILLRVGDLLDLDSNRTSLLCLDKCRNWIDAPGSLDHHLRHQCVRSFYYDCRGIKLRVQCEQRRQHQLWEQWLSYLRQDIELANTYVCRDDLAVFQLPIPDLKVERSPDATYELWPLRFEIDDDGALWEILRQSIYTGRLDFIREVIQNALDAGLRRVYDKNDSQLAAYSPRSWINALFQPKVVVVYVHSRKKLVVVDNGIGMTVRDLEKFLFRVAKTGVRGSRSDREFPFPSIAAFGVGFTSVLTRAKQVSIITRKATRSSIGDALCVQLSSTQREAYLERRASSPEGTAVRLDLKYPLKPDELREYFLETFDYTSAPIYFIDVDGLKEYVDAVDSLRTLQRLSVPVVRFADLSTPLIEGDVQQALHTVDQFLTLAHRQASDLSSRADSPKDNVGAMARRISTLPPPLIKIGGNALPSPPINEPLFISLDFDFSAIGIIAQRRLKLSDIRLGLMLVPVHIADYAKGIEWSSIHAFLVENGEIQRAASVVGRRGEYYTFGSDDLLFSGAEWDDEAEELDSNNWGESKQNEEFLETNVLFTRPDGIVFAEYDEIKESTMSSLKDQTPERYEYFDLGIGTRTRIRSSKEFGQALDAMDWFKKKRCAVYQDGILLPLNLRELACVGATAGIANLTAAARFRLNIARNAIDLNPSFLMNWQKATGKSICEEIARAVGNALELFGFVFRWDSLWMEVRSDLRLDGWSEWVGFSSSNEQ